MLTKSFKDLPAWEGMEVDVGEFELLALPTFRIPAAAILIEELGTMEPASIAFWDAVADLLERDTLVVATVHVFRYPFTDALKAQADAEVVHLARGNRDELPRLLAEKLVPPERINDRRRASTLVPAVK